jgi:hypothetical protein
VAFNRLGESIAIRAREWQVPEGQGRESHRLLERSRELRLSRAKAEAPFSFVLHSSQKKQIAAASIRIAEDRSPALNLFGQRRSNTGSSPKPVRVCLVLEIR